MSKYKLKTLEEKCLDDLVYYGEKKYKGAVSRGTAIGGAIAPYLSIQEILKLAAEALEDKNEHYIAGEIRKWIAPF